MLIGSLLPTLCSCLAGMALLLDAVPSAGGMQDAVARCGDPDPEISISACSGIIQAGRGSGRDLAVAHTHRGIAYVALLDYDRALQDFAQAIARDPRFSKAFANRGAVHGARQDFDKAIADFTQVLALEPGSAPAYADRASMYRLNGQYDEAIRDYSEAIRRDPLFVDAILNRAITLAGTSRCPDAIPDFTRVIELAAASAANGARIAYVDRGVCHEAAGREDLALKDYSEHLLLDPRSSYGLERRAALLFRTGQHDRALADYAQALIVNPSSAVALYGRGLVKRLRGDTAGGEADIAAATALHPGIAAQMAARGVKP
jgi:tetratricopeptide (TPR) repeat protein